MEKCKTPEYIVFELITNDNKVDGNHGKKYNKMVVNLSVIYLFIRI